jgi:hypothetical protein
MEVLTKDQSIVLQVAAKIASDLTIANTAVSVDQSVADWAAATQTVYSVLAEMHGWTQVPSPATVETVVAQVQAAFPQAEQVSEREAAAPVTRTVVAVPTVVTSLRIAGKQHGPIPDWLITACAKDGVTEVWDNRDTAAGTNRPLFKAVQGGKGYWDPSTSKYKK